MYEIRIYKDKNREEYTTLTRQTTEEVFALLREYSGVEFQKIVVEKK